MSQQKKDMQTFMSDLRDFFAGKKTEKEVVMPASVLEALAQEDGQKEAFEEMDEAQRKLEQSYQDELDEERKNYQLVREDEA